MLEVVQSRFLELLTSFVSILGCLAGTVVELWNFEAKKRGRCSISEGEHAQYLAYYIGRIALYREYIRIGQDLDMPKPHISKVFLPC